MSDKKKKEPPKDPFRKARIIAAFVSALAVVTHIYVTYFRDAPPEASNRSGDKKELVQHADARQRMDVTTLPAKGALGDNFHKAKQTPEKPVHKPAMQAKYKPGGQRPT